MRRTAAWHIDSRSRPSMGKLLSEGGLAHQGGHEPVDCQSIFGGDAPVVGSGVFCLLFIEILIVVDLTICSLNRRIALFPTYNYYIPEQLSEQEQLNNITN